MSQGVGWTKQPGACSARKVAEADICVDPMAQQYTCSGEGTMLRKSKAAQQRTHSKNASAKWSTARTATFWSASVSRRFYPYRQYQKSSEVYREAVLKLRRQIGRASCRERV